MSDTPALPPLPALSSLDWHTEGAWNIIDGEIWSDREGEAECLGVVYRTEAWTSGEPLETEDQHNAALTLPPLRYSPTSARCKRRTSGCGRPAENLVSRLWLDHPASYDVVDVHALHDLRAALAASRRETS